MAKKKDEGGRAKLEKQIARLSEDLKATRAALKAAEKRGRTAVKAVEKKAEKAMREAEKAVRRAEKVAAVAAADAVATAKWAMKKSAAAPLDHDAAVVEPEPDVDVPAEPESQGQTVASLREQARARGLHGYSSLRKDELIALLDR